MGALRDNDDSIPLILKTPCNILKLLLKLWFYVVSDEGSQNEPILRETYQNFQKVRSDLKFLIFLLSLSVWVSLS